MSLIDQIFNEARMNPEDWKKNFIVVGNPYYVCVQVVAAENGGWRAEVGFSKDGMVIEDPKQAMKSEWTKTFEGAENIAKQLSKTFGISWNPKPYGDRSKFKFK